MKKWLWMAVVLVLSGCSFQAAYKAEYVGDLPQGSPTIDGQALIFTERAEDERIYAKNPTSFTGGGTTLNVPLGDILKQISVEVFGRKFRQGVLAVNQKELKEGVVAVILPQITSFDYRYNSLRNVGFAVTPEVKLAISVTLLDRGGKHVFVRDYQSDYVSGDTYLVSAAPAERVNKLIHQVLTELLGRAAWDVEAQLQQAH